MIRDKRIRLFKPTAFQKPGQITVTEDKVLMLPKNNSKIISSPDFEEIDAATLLPVLGIEKR